MNNKNHEIISPQLSRVIHMETLYDEICEVVFRSDHSEADLALIRDKLEELKNYYSSSLWLEDYDADQKGLFLKDLKRGILSEDAIYDLLCTISEIEELNNGDSTV